jgi:hypothetical protein
LEEHEKGPITFAFVVGRRSELKRAPILSAKKKVPSPSFRKKSNKIGKKLRETSLKGRNTRPLKTCVKGALR